MASDRASAASDQGGRDGGASEASGRGDGGTREAGGAGEATVGGKRRETAVGRGATRLR
jgi:hypothetical protein